MADVLRHNLETTHVPDGVEGFRGVTAGTHGRHRHEGQRARVATHPRQRLSRLKQHAGDRDDRQRRPE
ncbi:MAG: hypothetical protein R2710_30370 [Acidimicrobiales bacterium]